MRKKEKIFVGLSGGVDSAVSAALLKKEGHEVIGVFLKTWHPEYLPCSWREERRDAMRVAAHLDIPFMTLDLEKEYKEGVADRMIAEYEKGRTPNPDVLCNKEVKFGAFLAFAKKRGGSLATGHYARIEKEKGRAHLLAGKDPEKDQSYFLWMVKGEDLNDVLFPVGDLTKKEVRVLAKEFGLPNAAKKDSQGICFLGKVSLEEFLGHHVVLEEGDVLNEKGETIGRHKGSPLYTLGQRHGFEVRVGAPSPFYVVAKDADAKTITVAHAPSPSQLKERIHLREENWIGEISEGSCEVRLRYRESLRKARLVEDKGHMVVHLDEGTLVPLGQSLVAYRRERLLGGGIIDSAS